MTTDPLDQPQQSTANRSTTASATAPAGPSPMVIGAIVTLLLIGGFYLASRIANSDEAPEKTSQKSQPIVAKTKPPSNGYISPLAVSRLGVTLYDKETKQPWGTIAAMPDSEQVEVLRINNMALGDDRTRGIPALYDSSYITSNFVVKDEKRSLILPASIPSRVRSRRP